MKLKKFKSIRDFIKSNLNCPHCKSKLNLCLNTADQFYFTYNKVSKNLFTCYINPLRKNPYGIRKSKLEINIDTNIVKIHSQNLYDIINIKRNINYNLPCFSLVCSKLNCPLRYGYFSTDLNIKGYKICQFKNEVEVFIGNKDFYIQNYFKESTMNLNNRFKVGDTMNIPKLDIRKTSLTKLHSIIELAKTFS